GQRLEIARRMLFKDCAAAFIEAKRSEWSNAVHARQWTTTLESYVFPTLGNLPVASIDTGLVVKCLTPLWNTRRETASRVRGRIESVLNWATSSGYRTGENPARWKGHLENLLPKRNKARTVEHLAALPYQQIGQ